MVQIGDKLQLDIARIRDDGRATAFSEDGTLIIIESLPDNSKTVEVEITRVFEETAFANLLRAMPSENKLLKRKDIVDSPYELDEDESDNSDEDDEGA
jgi:predicted RNA-binding protein with TRAM domain